MVRDEKKKRFNANYSANWIRVFRTTFPLNAETTVSMLITVQIG